MCNLRKFVHAHFQLSESFAVHMFELLPENTFEKRLTIFAPCIILKESRKPQRAKNNEHQKRSGKHGNINF
jgi:hypothetical protein